MELLLAFLKWIPLWHVLFVQLCTFNDLLPFLSWGKKAFWQKLLQVVQAKTQKYRQINYIARGTSPQALLMCTFLTCDKWEEFPVSQWRWDELPCAGCGEGSAWACEPWSESNWLAGNAGSGLHFSNYCCECPPIAFFLGGRGKDHAFPWFPFLLSTQSSYSWD